MRSGCSRVARECSAFVSHFHMSTLVNETVAGDRWIERSGFVVLNAGDCSRVEICTGPDTRSQNSRRNAASESPHGGAPPPAQPTAQRRTPRAPPRATRAQRGGHLRAQRAQVGGSRRAAPCTTIAHGGRPVGAGVRTLRAATVCTIAHVARTSAARSTRRRNGTLLASRRLAPTNFTRKLALQRLAVVVLRIRSTTRITTPSTGPDTRSQNSRRNAASESPHGGTAPHAARAPTHNACARGRPPARTARTVEALVWVAAGNRRANTRINEAAPRVGYYYARGNQQQEFFVYLLVY
ncbi:hypothetical protein F511_13027 [Dorcoceras hygrometricum]|uniref:Uncharacterized protein n=1 Tax=Dorcoceras hygrometricum TaxID=472368 RepID=A0A2Z7AHK4_9LAMI|nr:hypothetical protein F511_13027 [Dorcoceras hygrometricum]